MAIVEVVALVILVELDSGLSTIVIDFELGAYLVA